LFKQRRWPLAAQRPTPQLVSCGGKLASKQSTTVTVTLFDCTLPAEF
jgi:hypothetical protein